MPLLRVLARLLVALAAGAAIFFAYSRLRLRQHLLPGVSPFEARSMWEKSDFYDAEGRRLLARCGWALEICIGGGALGGLLLILAS